LGKGGGEWGGDRNRRFTVKPRAKSMKESSWIKRRKTHEGLIGRRRTQQDCGRGAGRQRLVILYTRGGEGLGETGDIGDAGECGHRYQKFDYSKRLPRTYEGITLSNEKGEESKNGEGKNRPTRETVQTSGMKAT